MFYIVDGIITNTFYPQKMVSSKMFFPTVEFVTADCFCINVDDVGTGS